MCPLCLSALGWIAAGGASLAGIGLLFVKPTRNGEDDDDTPDRHA